MEGITTNRASQHLHSLTQLKLSGLTLQDLGTFYHIYRATIRRVFEYAAPVLVVWHQRLTERQKEDAEKIQKLAVQNIQQLIYEDNRYALVQRRKRMRMRMGMRMRMRMGGG